MKLVGVLFLLLMTTAAFAQKDLPLIGMGGAAGGCVTPAGLTMTESMGDSSVVNSWGTGTNVLWSLTGTGATIVATPAGAAVNTACANSLQMVTGTANNYIQTVGYTPTVPAGTAFSTTIYFYPTASSLGGFNAQSFYVPSADSSGVNVPCKLTWHTTTLGQLYLRVDSASATGSTDSAQVTLNAWHMAVLSSNGTTCAASLDGTQFNTIAASSYPILYQTIGTIAGNTQSISYDIGYYKLDATGITGSANPQYVWMNFENGTNGATFSTAVAAAGTVAGNGTWATGGTTPTALTISTGAQYTLLNGPISVAGTSYTDTGTRGVCFNLATATSGYNGYTWNSLNTSSASVGYWMTTTLPTGDSTSYVSMGQIANQTGSDFAAVMEHNGQLYLETNANPNGVADSFSGCTNSQGQNYTAGSRYWITMQFNKYVNASTRHYLNIYDSTGTLLCHQEKVAQSVSPSQPIAFYVGRGGDTGTPAAQWCVDNLVIDYNKSTFPLTPQ